MDGDSRKKDSEQERRLELAVETRKFEIELFWRRSVFFWGFISAAFVGFATLDRLDSRLLALVIACFGLVCSVAWTLVNRGSKYWQENWEQKVNREEVPVLGGKFFAQQEPVEGWKSFWLRSRRFSVSKLTIALSDFTVLVWIVIVLLAATDNALLSWNVIRIVLPAGTALFITFMVWEGRTSTELFRPNNNKQEGDRRAEHAK